MKRIKPKKIQNLGTHIILCTLLFLLLYPLAMAVWGAFKNANEFAKTQWYPTLPLDFSSFISAFKKLSPAILNTVFIACVGAAGVLFLSSITAYAFARMKFPGKEFLYMLILGLLMIPSILTLVPSFMLYKKLLGTDNHWIMIVPLWVGSPVGGVFLMRSFIEGIPESVFEAARLDGAGEFKLYTKMCLPLSVPIMGTMTINLFTSVWNDYMWPMITIKDESLLTVSAMLFLKYNNNAGSYPAMYAGYLVTALPLIILFILMTKHYVEGLSSSAIKM